MGASSPPAAAAGCRRANYRRRLSQHRWSAHRRAPSALRAGGRARRGRAPWSAPFRRGAAAAASSGARPRMTPIEKQRTGPDVDRLLILRGKVVVEADEEQLLDLRIAIGFQRTIVRVGWIAS